jgi:hypothetical protein
MELMNFTPQFHAFLKGHFKAPNVEPSISYMSQWLSLQSFSFHLCCFYWGLMGHSNLHVLHTCTFSVGDKQDFTLTNLSKWFGSFKIFVSM